MRILGVLSMIYMALGAGTMGYALLTMPWNLHPFNLFIVLVSGGFAVFVAGLIIGFTKRHMDTQPVP